MATNSIGPSGLTIQSLSDVIAQLTAGFQAIYGNVNVNPNSPDGQMILLFAQAKLDTLQLIASMNASWDPDQATGVNLDRACAYNGVQRDPGTYTEQVVNVTTSTGPITLQGLNASPNPFTVADGQGNQYELLATTTLPSPGTYALSFRAALLGPVQSAAAAITVPVSIIPGVTSVTNPTGPATVGQNEESDPALRLRRANSVSLPSKGYLQGLYGALLDVEGVSFAKVYENTGSSADVNGTPGHSIWCIVDVTGSDYGTIASEVGEAIYVKRNAGCGMRGSESVTITQVDGSQFAVLFDNAVSQNLWIKAQIDAITGVVDLNYINSKILAAFGSSYGIGQAADSSSVVAFIKGIAPNAYVSNEGVSVNGSSWFPIVNPTGPQYQFGIAGSSYIELTS